MNANKPLYRFPVVIFSLLLLIGYVYVRSGGSVPHWGTTNQETPVTLPAAQPTILPGSKSDIVFEADEKTQPVAESDGLTHDEAKALIYGSKSAPVFLPMDKPVNPNTVPVPADTALLPGSKSAAVVVPPSAPLNTPGAISSTTLLPGSKSIILVEPSQAQQPVQQSANRPSR